MAVRLVVTASLLLLPSLRGEVFQGRIDAGKPTDDGCPRNFRLCNEACLDKTTNHTTPCHTGPWGKCLSAHFPFYCSVTDTCIGKNEICGDQCFDGNPESFWYDHNIYDTKGTFGRKVNAWKLGPEVSDSTEWKSLVLVSVFLQRYNCNGKCIHYREACNGGCDHPAEIMKGGKTINLDNPVQLVKCGGSCRGGLNGFHDCGDDCLPQEVPCNGVCAPSTVGATGPQWLCGDECRPKDQKSWKFQDKWRVCSDGTCRDKSVNCDGTLPGTCPTGQILCRYNSWVRGTDFKCLPSNEWRICNETRAENGLATFLGKQKHPDETCNSNSEPCEGECVPGYVACETNNGLTCEKEVKCGVSGVKTCGDKCACRGDYFKCGDKCIESDSEMKDCNGVCVDQDKVCDGKCLKSGWFKFGLSGDICKKKPRKGYKKCNGNYLKYTVACNGVCETKSRKLCSGGKSCLKRWERWTCDGDCIGKDENCNGECDEYGEVPCGKKCKDEYDMNNGNYQTCGDECISGRELCNGVCGAGMVACGKSCYGKYDGKGDSRTCGDECLSNKFSCEGKCADDRPFKCMDEDGEEVCLKQEQIGDGNQDCEDGSDESTYCFKQWSCNGKMQCVTKPCPKHDPQDPEQTMCPSQVEKEINSWSSNTKSFRMYHCAAEDACKLEGIPCNGVCMATESNVDPVKNVVPESFDYGGGGEDYDYDYDYKRLKRSISLEAREQFACEDGSKCIEKSKACDGKKDCDDGSDEFCRCKGEINCQERLRAKGSSVYEMEFRCESGDEYVALEKYCNGKADCKDGSDERCEKCPGIIKCRNGDLVCKNVPCNNTEANDFTCEAGDRDLCQTGPHEAKCVRRVVDLNEYTTKVINGELCNGECLTGVRCGDKCVPKFEEWNPSCNSLCDHIPSSEPLTQCGGYCLTEDQVTQSRRSSSVQYHRTLVCDGECRVHGSGMQKKESSRRTCNGTCLSGDGNQEWFPCSSGDECFSAEEWCNGERNCQDGTDEAKCSQCPKIKNCVVWGNKKHPLVNQTSSIGPRFPDFVCTNEPCGECSDEDTFPCGNQCISTDEVCPVSDLCSSPGQFKCDKCLEVAAVCDGKVDCNDGTDENNCRDDKGSWMCNGVMQEKTKPCL